MMTLLSICLSLLILGVLLWVVAMCLDIATAQVDLPPGVKKVVLVLLFLVGLVSILSGYRLPFP